MFNDVTRPMYHAEWSLGEGGEVVRRKRRGGGGGGIKGWDSRWGGGLRFSMGSLHGRVGVRGDVCGDAIKK